MRILWLSNRLFETGQDTKSGTWLSSLGPELVNSGRIILGNISVGNVTTVERMDFGAIWQWAVPSETRRKNGLPCNNTIFEIKRAVYEFNPDIIQIWGTENYWGLLTARGILTGKTLLNIQGLIGSISKVFYGGLSNREILKCIGLKEIVRPSYSLFSMKKHFENRIKFEREIIEKHKYIVTQSEWVSAHIATINTNFIHLRTERTLRREFIECTSWHELHHVLSAHPVLFISTSFFPYKGLYVAIRALSILKRKFPTIKLKIAGTHTQKGLRRSGYEKYLRKLIANLNLGQNIIWLGPIGAHEIVTNMQTSDVYINTSFVESYSLSLSEALMVGIPSVISYAGAMPELSQDEITGLFFTPGDYVGCSRQIERLLTNLSLSLRLSKAAHQAALIRHNYSTIIKNQIFIYESIMREP